jgi:outer membrane murein-binding lipoprotein Lpp
MFKKLCLFAAVIVFALLCGCDFEFDFKDVDEYSGFATEFYEACDELTEHAETLIEEEQAIVKSFFPLIWHCSELCASANRCITLLSA